MSTINRTQALRDRANALVTKTQALGDLCTEASQIRSSLELHNARIAYATIWAQAFATVNEIPSDLADKDFDSFEATISQLEGKLDETRLPIVLGIKPLTARNVTHWVVTQQEFRGCTVLGVFTAHDKKEDAQYNAMLTGGRVIRVERDSDGSILPPASDAPMIVGIKPPNADNVTHQVVTATNEYGYGTYTGHDNPEDARYNARLVNGTHTAVTRDSSGRIIKSAAHRYAERIRSEYC